MCIVAVVFNIRRNHALLHCCIACPFIWIKCPLHLIGLLLSFSSVSPWKAGTNKFFGWLLTLFEFVFPFAERDSVGVHNSSGHDQAEPCQEPEWYLGLNVGFPHRALFFAVLKVAFSIKASYCLCASGWTSAHAHRQRGPTPEDFLGDMLLKPKKTLFSECEEDIWKVKKTLHVSPGAKGTVGLWPVCTWVQLACRQNELVTPSTVED